MMYDLMLAPCFVAPLAISSLCFYVEVEGGAAYPYHDLFKEKYGHGFIPPMVAL
jgi:hypothetical protein